MDCPVVLDTGPLVAMLDRNDSWHQWAGDQIRYLTAPMLTCEAVVSESIFLLRPMDPSCAQLTGLFRDGIVRLDFALQDNFSAVATLLAKYQEVPMSLADACLVRMSELHDRARVFTLDSAFRHYRRHGRQTIPLLHPAR